MFKKILFVSFMMLVLAGCATKRYPIATPLSEAGAELMTCRELQIELIDTQQIRQQITETREFDWRSVASFMGDLGIGNNMAKSEADTALEGRVTTIRDAQLRNECFGSEDED